MSTFPQPWRSTVSHWQATHRGPTSLWLHNADKDTVPAEVDILIVGGGMTGAAMSYFLTRPGAHGAGKKVVCVEAKDVASGATGRNGGHVGPKTYVMWDELMQPYPLGLGCDEEEACRITQSERDNLDLVAEVVEKERLDVDFWRGDLLETHHSTERSAWSKEKYAAWLAVRKRLGMAHDDTRFVDDPAEAEKVSRLKGCTSVHVRPGGSVHSHKLCTALMRKAIESPASQFQFYSWTPVSGVPIRTEDGRWKVTTSKGDILARQVILCTNAHTGNFFAEADPVHSHITPFRGQCCTITPPPTYSGSRILKNTYNTLDGRYLVTAASGQLILGGGLAPLVRDGKIPIDDSVGQVDDSEKGINPVLTDDLSKFMPAHFIDWGPEAYGEGLTRTWTGIMGDSRDSLPLVGELPGKEGLSVVAGFSGHGMSRIFVSARAYAHTLRTGAWDTSLLPSSYKVTAERLARAQTAQKEFEAEHGKGVVVIEGQVLGVSKQGGARSGCCIM